MPDYLRSVEIDRPEKIGAAPCIRCDGSGTFESLGSCFRCGGTGKDPSQRDWVFPAEWSDDDIASFHARRLKRNTRVRTRRAEQVAADSQLQIQRNLDRFPELDGIYPRYLDGHFETDGFITSVLSLVSEIDLSEGHADAVRKAVSEFDAQRLARSVSPVVVGTYEIHGQLVSTRITQGPFGPIHKGLLVTPSRQRLYGTLPASLAESSPGDRVAFTATVVRSDDDPSFGLFSRPRKARKVDEQG